MKVLIVGANGRIGTRLFPLLIEKSHAPVAMIRSEDQSAKFESLGAESVVGDLENPVDHCLEGIDAVVFTAGSGSKTGRDKTILIDHIGAIRMAATAEFAGIRRFIMVSAIGASAASEHPKIAHYMKAKGCADAFIRERDTDWTIMKPGSLTEEAGNGKIAASRNFAHSGPVSMDDVAQTIVAILEDPSTFKTDIEILDGDTPIKEAIQALNP